MKLPVLGQSHVSLANESPTARVWVTVTGALDDAGALRFGTALAESMGVELWIAPDANLSEEGLQPVVAVGLGLTQRLSAEFSIVISGGVPRSGWRDRTLLADLELADPRLGVARALGKALRSKFARNGPSVG